MADTGWCPVRNRKHENTDFHSMYLHNVKAHVEVCRECGRTPNGALPRGGRPGK